MQPTYERCKEVLKSDNAELKKQNTNKKTRISEILRAKVTGAASKKDEDEDEDDDEMEGSVFFDVSQMVNKAFEGIMEQWEKVYYAPELASAYKRVLADFDRRFRVPEEVKDELDEEAIEALKEAANEALKIIEGPMKEHLDKCDGYEQGLND
jgi:hypothetical protein